MQQKTTKESMRNYRENYTRVLNTVFPITNAAYYMVINTGYFVLYMFIHGSLDKRETDRQFQCNCQDKILCSQQQVTNERTEAHQFENDKNACSTRFYADEEVLIVEDKSRGVLKVDY